MSKSILASASIATLLVCSPFVSSTAAFGCTVGSGSAEVNHSSSISQDTVTVCLDLSESTPGSTASKTSLSTKTTKSTKTAKKKVASKNTVIPKSTPKPLTAKKTSKPACPSSQQLLSMPRSADAMESWLESICNPAKPVIAAPKPAKKIVIVKRPVIKQKTFVKKISVSLPAASARSGAQAIFKPNSLLASYFPNTVLGIGQEATFQSFPALHFKTQGLLGKRAEVEFTPRAVSWSFSDGAQLQGSSVGHGFTEPGSYQARARVSYSVRYRLLGESDWKQVSGSITLVSNLLQVMVGNSALENNDSRVPLIVGESCQGQPEAIGCAGE